MRGFKSLTNFNLELNPGLNVLVGPNGAGKTNVLKFLEFLSDLCENSVSAAVSHSGGAGEIFQRKAHSSQNAKIWFQVEGSGKSQISHIHSRRAPGRGHDIHYIYEAEITLTENSVFFSAQRIEIRMGEAGSGTPALLLHSSFDYKSKKQSGRATISKEMASGMPINNAQKFISQMLVEDRSITERALLLSFKFFTPGVEYITSDINYGKAYNINPSKVRESEDIAKNPGISFDGSGLASTLILLKKIATDLTRGPLFPGFYPNLVFDNNTFSQIESICCLVNDNVVGLDAKPDLIENKNRVIVKFIVAGKEVEFPISLISDGTAKWFALITAMVTSKTAFCIEEPENFIHPKLQQEIVKIARSLAENAEYERFVLMTTHSQTLLNALKPEEVVVTSMSPEGTQCKRPTNAAKLNQMISKTGFGLGYFYLTDAIES